MHRGAGRPAAVVLVLALATLGCASTRSASSPTTAPQPGETSRASAGPTCAPAPIDQRAAQVLVVGLPGVTVSSDPIVADVLAVGVGGFLVTEPNVSSSAQVSQLVSDLRAVAGRPLAIVAGEESGRVATFDSIFGTTPSARRLAATSSPDEVRALAEEVGSKLAAIGVDVDLAPVVDLNDGPAGAIIGDRSFSADPATASAYGLAWAQGLASAGVRPTAKHFPGQGRVDDDTHLGLANVDASLDELMERDLRPFADLIGAGVPLVMVDHVAYAAFDPDLPASLSPQAYQLLRQMGFEGVAITDSVGMGAVNLRWPFPEAAVLAVAAGADAVLTTDGTQALEMREALVEAVRSGRLPEARLDEAAGRMAALSGGDPQALVCRPISLPRMEAAPAG